MLNFFRSETTEEHKVAELAELFEHEIVQKRKKQNAERLERLRELLDRKQSILADRDRAIAARTNDATIARQDQEKIAKEFESASRRRALADLELQGASFDFTSKIAALEVQMRKLAPAVIDKFCNEMFAEIDMTRLKANQVQRLSFPNPFSGAQKVIFRGNYSSVAGRLAAIRNAVDEAESFKYLDLTEAEILTRLDRLRESLPDVFDEEESYPQTDVYELQRKSD